MEDLAWTCHDCWPGDRNARFELMQQCPSSYYRKLWLADLMIPTMNVADEWKVETEQDREEVRAQLQRILESHPFRNSKRYPALLSHSVHCTLSGATDRLRERQLGVELFGRSYDYDTNADPIVRVTAGEVRKRLAQFYAGDGRDDNLRVSIPPGTYVAHFHAVDANPFPIDLSTAILPIPDLDLPADPTWVARHWIAILGVVAAVAVLILAFFALRDRSAKRLFWSDFLDGHKTIPTVVGQNEETSDSTVPVDQTPLAVDIHRQSQLLSLSDASATLSICSTIAQHDRSCAIYAAPTVDISGLKNRSILLVGDYNNDWVIRLTNSLPYHFGPGTHSVIDMKTNKPMGSVDYQLPRDLIHADYGIVAHFHSDVTDGNALVIAGVGPMSTEAAAEFINSEAHLKEIYKLSPAHWNGKNFEVALETDIVDGSPGHTRIIGSSFW
jgi:hypothetical protein